MRELFRTAAVAVLVLVFGAPSPSALAQDDADDLLAFGTEMALKGSWREARFRWERAERLAPEDSRLLNNLAVAAEALGEFDTAADYYRRALDRAPGDGRIGDNALRAGRFRAKIGGATATPEPLGAAAAADRGQRRRGVVEVTVRLPEPPRLDVRERSTILVASFLVEDSGLLDANREVVRFLRSEFRKYTALDVLEVTPAPAVPEQTPDDMAANDAFWAHLGREHGADLVVSGRLRYERSDASAYQEVDFVDERNGHKIKQTRFVEQERFVFETEVFFFDGASGGLLHRERFRREALFRGQANDPITAFHDLIATISGDVLSVVSPRIRSEVRLLFR